MKTSLVAVIVLLLAGCAGQRIQPDETITVAQSNRIGSAALAQPGQSIDAAYRVRDLTKPWSQRRYLLTSNDLRTPRRTQ